MRTKIRETIRQMNSYFRKSQVSIAESNISLVKGICACGFVVVGLLLFAADILIRNWSISFMHFLFLPFFVIYYLWAEHLRKDSLYHKELIRVMVLSFMCIFMFLVIWIETVQYPDNIATLVTPVMIVLPLVLIQPIMTTFLYLLVSYGVLCMLSCLCSGEKVVRANAFNGLVGVLFGFLVACVVTNLRAREEHIKQVIIKNSQEDKLTGILNKSTVEQECFNYLDLFSHESCALIVLDVDSFKNVNDMYGHQRGDQVLSILGETLTKVFRERDILGRIGGDEFIVLMKNVHEKDLVVKKMTDFSELFAKEMKEKVGQEITCSYGAVIKSEMYMSYVPLFELADRLLYKAKSNGRACGCVKTVEEL